MIAHKLRNLVNSLVLERPGRRKTLAQWADALVASGDALAARVARVSADSARNRARLNHVIGIERWCQRRLRVFLGDPAVRDEYDGYRLGDNVSLDELLTIFRAERAETVELIQAANRLAPDVMPATVDHNQFGPLSIYAWIRYIDMHASWESKYMR